jgi:hypothetical protein
LKLKRKRVLKKLAWLLKRLRLKLKLKKSADRLKRPRA